ncbi:MAG: hypothetical protein ACR2JR_01590 [Rubrobacteraceae bacterium]
MTLDLRAGLYEACRQISPIHPNYATLPIQTGFDWSALSGRSFDGLYLVVFRSVRRMTADLDLLREYDDHAYKEALGSGGLLRYFKGDADERGQCLSFCLWKNREDARRASGGKMHGEAARLTAEMYESYLLERYELTASEDIEAEPVFRRL